MQYYMETIMRAIALFLFNHIPLGKAAPYVFNFIIGNKKYKKVKILSKH